MKIVTIEIISRVTINGEINEVTTKVETNMCGIDNRDEIARFLVNRGFKQSNGFFSEQHDFVVGCCAGMYDANKNGHRVDILNINGKHNEMMNLLKENKLI